MRLIKNIILLIAAIFIAEAIYPLFYILGLRSTPFALVLAALAFLGLRMIVKHWDVISKALLSLASQDLLDKDGPAPERDAALPWQRTAFFLAAWLYLYLTLASVFLTVCSAYLNRNRSFMRYNYSLNPVTKLTIGGLTLLLTVFLLRRLRQDSRFQTAASVFSLILGVLAVLTLLGLEGPLQTASLLVELGRNSASSALETLSFSLISLPDLGVLKCALPSIVLGYFGRPAPTGRSLGHMGKLLSYTCILISCTFVGDLLQGVLPAIFG